MPDTKFHATFLSRWCAFQARVCECVFSFGLAPPHLIVLVLARRSARSHVLCVSHPEHRVGGATGDADDHVAHCDHHCDSPGRRHYAAPHMV